jgi:hypothetical protein
MEDLMSEDTVKIEAEIYEETHGRKMQKRQIQWGPVQRVARPRRYPKDGKTMMLRAQELKEYKNLCKGNKPTPINASESTESFIAKANCVNISLGTNTEMINSNVDLILTKDLMGRKEFLEKNPEINLPADLEINLDLENFPSLVSQSNTLTSAPLKEVDESLENSWVRITSKGLKPSSSKNVNNDRCNLECRGLNKRGKLQCIIDFMYENKLYFMDFQETKKKIVFMSLSLYRFIRTLAGIIYLPRALQVEF